MKPLNPREFEKVFAVTETAMAAISAANTMRPHSIEAPKDSYFRYQIVDGPNNSLYKIAVDGSYRWHNHRGFMGQLAFARTIEFTEGMPKVNEAIFTPLQPDRNKLLVEAFTPVRLGLNERAMRKVQVIKKSELAVATAGINLAQILDEVFDPRKA